MIVQLCLRLPCSRALSLKWLMATFQIGWNEPVLFITGISSPSNASNQSKRGDAYFCWQPPTKCGGEGVLYPPMKCMSWLEVTTVHSQCFPWDWPEKLGRLLDRWPLVFPKEVTSQCWVKQQVKHCAFPTAHDTRRNRNISQHTVNIGTCFFLLIYIYTLN